jgi:hypothetical protein
MPGFLGGSGGGGGGGGGEIFFPKEFIDPVTKFRVSQPENLIDTDFEYGLQPTKWETVELINNTPSFFSKSGDTTIDGIISITTNAGTREITVITALDHNLAAGIPINVTGTKSLTADGSFIIASIPNPTTFTYLCKSNQNETLSINDLYTSIITGEFFQGSQIGISDSEGILTDGSSTSILTVKTKSTHGFGLKTPLYLLNINSTISQDFQAANNATRSFDASNSATAQTFDGSNTLSTINVDLSNSGVESSIPSTIVSVSTTANTITVSHGTENFSGLKVGTPLYYDVTSGVGYFAQNPRGVVFLKTTDGLSTSFSTFKVSELPDGDEILIESSVSGTFQVSDLSRTFAGNNVDLDTQFEITIEVGEERVFDGGNQGFDGSLSEGETAPNNTSTVVGFTADSITITGAQDLDYYEGAMVFYTTTGSAATGLTNNTTYFIRSFSAAGAPGIYSITVSALPTSAILTGLSGGTGTQRFEKIGISVDKNIVHVRNSNFSAGDLLQYTRPEDGSFQASVEEQKNFYVVFTAFDSSNYRLSSQVFIPTIATGGAVTESYSEGRYWRVHAFTSTGSDSFEVSNVGTEPEVEVLVVGGGGGGGGAYGAAGGGGAGGLVYHAAKSINVGTYAVTVGAGGVGGSVYTATNNSTSPQIGRPGGNSSFDDIVAIGGGGGNMSFYVQGVPSLVNGGSGGGGGDYFTGTSPTGAWRGGLALQGNSGGGLGYGFPGGSRGPNGPTPAEDSTHAQPHEGAGGGGAGGTSTGGNASNPSNGGIGRQYDQFAPYGSPIGWFAGGGGGGQHFQNRNYPTNESVGFPAGGFFGGGGQGANEHAQNSGNGSTAATPGLPNTGGGGGGGARNYSGGSGPAPSGGSGIVLVRYPITAPPSGEYMVATGGVVSVVTVGSIVYAVHSFVSIGSSTFTVKSLGTTPNANNIEFLVVGGGGGGGMDMGGGGGGGAVVSGTVAVPNNNTSYSISVGAGGRGAPRGGIGTRSQGTSVHNFGTNGSNGQNSSISGGGLTRIALGGGFGGTSYHTSPLGGTPNVGGSGGGRSAYSNDNGIRAGAASNQFSTYGYGSGSRGGRGGPAYFGGGGGGAGGIGADSSNRPDGGPGVSSNILGVNYFWGGGGGGSGYSAVGGNGGVGGGGGGAVGVTTGGAGLNNGSPGGGGGINSQANVPGGSGGANTGGGGGGGAHYGANNQGGNGGSGIVVIRYPIGVVN